MFKATITRSLTLYAPLPEISPSADQSAVTVPLALPRRLRSVEMVGTTVTCWLPEYSCTLAGAVVVSPCRAEQCRRAVRQEQRACSHGHADGGCHGEQAPSPCEPSASGTVRHGCGVMFLSHESMPFYSSIFPIPGLAICCRLARSRRGRAHGRRRRGCRDRVWPRARSCLGRKGCSAHG